MGWPELLDHPFWRDAIRKEEYAEEEEESAEEENQEEEKSCEGVCSRSVRCVGVRVSILNLVIPLRETERFKKKKIQPVKMMQSI